MGKRYTLYKYDIANITSLVRMNEMNEQVFKRLVFASLRHERNTKDKEKIAMPMYIKTLHIVETREEADAFNDARDYCSEIYAPEYAIPYGVVPHGRRFETAIFHYSGARNSTYENALAQFQRNDIHRSFTD